jgi:RimJ/RimL family protein N-acetyltransferase
MNYRKIYIDKKISLIDFKILEYDASLLSLYLSWLKNKDIIKFIFSKELNESNFDKNFIDKSIQRFDNKNCEGYFVYHEEKQKFIGTCKLDNIDFFNKKAWDGIMIGDKSFHGIGVGDSVYDILLSYAKNFLKIDYIYSGCSELNRSMIKILKKKKYELYMNEKNVDNFNNCLYDHYYFKLDLKSISVSECFIKNYHI